MLSLQNTLILAPVAAVCLAGCGGGDPLGMDGRRGSLPPASIRGDGKDDPAKPAVNPVPVTVVAPTLVDPKYVDTVPGEMPKDLAATIAGAADHLAKDNRRAALQLLVDPLKIQADRTNLDALVKEMPKINAMLLEGTLRRALKTPPRLSKDGLFALFEVSDSSHVRFNRLDGIWRLNDNRRPDADTPGRRYDDAPKHAVFLLRKLVAVEAAAEPGWSDAEKPTVAALESEGAGLARGVTADGKPAVTVVFPQAFKGNDASVSRLKELAGVRVVSTYLSPLSDAALAGLADLPDLQGVRMLQNLVTNETLAATSKLTRLTTLSVNSVQQATVALAPLASLTQVEQLELNNLSFERAEIDLLVPLSRMKRLDVTLSTIDDKCLDRLRKFSQLESLMISTNSVTADGVAGLRGAVPKLFLDW